MPSMTLFKLDSAPHRRLHHNNSVLRLVDHGHMILAGQRPFPNGPLSHAATICGQ